ncbi:MAG: hypothetical protein RBS36_12450 [Thiomicrospira sp.]|jgi:hypothetical protein|nr:hypothetical protein [Thiomicrospira sp.]
MSNENALIQYEGGQTPHLIEAMTTNDNQIFTATFKPFSLREGFEVSVMPLGLINGGKITPGDADSVNVATALASMPTLSAADTLGQATVTGAALVLARPTTGTHLIYSIVINGSGAFEAIAGEEGAAFNDTRGEFGGAPFIPVDAIEVGQVRLASQDSAAIEQNAIFQVPGLHQEMADFPLFDVVAESGQVKFNAPLAAIHVGGTAKRVYVRGYTPLFVDVPSGSAWKAAENSYSTNSTQVYGGTIGSTSKTLNAAGFNAVLKDGHTDPIMSIVGKKGWFKFKQNRYRAPYQLTLGTLGLARSFPADGNVEGAFTISPAGPSIDFPA